MPEENREKYVELYIDYLFNESCKGQFQSFFRGFHRVCSGQAFAMLQRGPSFRTFAADSKLRSRRTGILRTERTLASVGFDDLKQHFT